MSLFGKKTTAQIIDKVNTTTELPRHYLGVSQIGNECERSLWYYFRWCYTTTIDGRINRLFNYGHKAEADMISDLESAGITITSDKEKQDEYCAVSGHLRGHSDSRGEGFQEDDVPEEEYLIEFKTSNTKVFKEVVKKGVKEAKPVHYDQATVYGFLAGLKRVFYMMLNKETLAYHTETFEVDEKHAKELIQKAELIITTENINELPKIGGKSWYACKICDSFNVCQNNSEYEVTCRTCVNADICDGGKWECGLTGKELTVEDQKKACSKYESIKDMAQ